MNIGFVSTRLAGTDGVSLETAKLATVAQRMGHHVFYCAGELDGDLPGLVAPELHFQDPVARALGERAFARGGPGSLLFDDIRRRAQELKRPLRRFLDEYGIEYLIIENAFAIPMQLPLAQALRELLLETNLPALAHNHDFYWERDRFRSGGMTPFLDTYFPPKLPRLRHATINSLAQAALRRRRGIESVVLPNVFDFAAPSPGLDDYNADFREEIGLHAEDWLILQPTRVVPRKGIELSIELLAQLKERRAKLVISHPAGDEGLDYLHFLQRLAQERGVALHYVAQRVAERRGRTADGQKVYSLWDVYPQANLVTYPSLVEGFGNALIETVYFRRPAVVNRYDVYVADIAPLGFRFAEIDGAITPETLATVREWLEAPATVAPLVAHNYALGQKHFSYEALYSLLAPLLAEAAG